MRKISFCKITFIAGFCLLVACQSNKKELDNLERHIQTLASDEYQGRKPFTPGEDKTIEYIKKEFENIGLEPGNNGSYFQDVPLVEVNGTSSKKLNVKVDGEVMEFERYEEFTAFTRHLTGKIFVDECEMVFAGYGIVAPEYNWNDYEGIDVKGKTVIIIVNDPGYGTNDTEFFKGNTMTYYGRWTYKYEEAARQGATGVLIIHETGPAGYPWGVVRNGATVPKLYLQPEDKYLSRCAFEGWMTKEAASRLFEGTGKDLDECLANARNPGFSGYSLEAFVSLTINNELRYDVSKNVIALYPGSERADECIIYTAHWDHLGIGPVIDGDSIYNGATDNASAVAWMLEIARYFTELDKKPSRSVLFMAVTAEEQGLLGSYYYTANPVFPLTKTVAVINTDVILFLGEYNDVTITGFGQSELDDYIKEAAKEQDRYIMADENPENGMYFRSDHFAFAKVGIPSLFAKGYSDQREFGKEWTTEKISEYWNKVYHKPCDEYDPSRDRLEGLAQDVRLFFNLGHRLSNETSFPQWLEGSEFKAVRDKMMSETGK